LPIPHDDFDGKLLRTSKRDIEIMRFFEYQELASGIPD